MLFNNGPKLGKTKDFNHMASKSETTYLSATICTEDVIVDIYKYSDNVTVNIQEKKHGLPIEILLGNSEKSTSLSYQKSLNNDSTKDKM